MLSNYNNTNGPITYHKWSLEYMSRELILKITRILISRVKFTRLIQICFIRNQLRVPTNVILSMKNHSQLTRTRNSSSNFMILLRPSLKIS